MDSANYRHIIAQIKKSSMLPHHVYPSYNLLSIDTLLQLTDGNNFPENVPCYVPFEYEVKSSSVFLLGCNTVDEATDLVKKKLQWEKKFDSMELCNLNSVIDSMKKIKRNIPTKLSARVMKYVNHFYNDPEPYFKGSYNWLYTGGSITSVRESQGTALVCADYSGKKPGFNVVKLSESLDRIVHKSFYQLKTFFPILQITCKTKGDNFIVCVRQKNQVGLFSIDGTGPLTHPTKLWRKKAVNDKLFTSSDISADCKQAAISDTNYDVHVIDIESGTKTFGFVGKNLIPESVADRWGHVFFDNLGLYATFRNRLHVLDLRDPYARSQLLFDPVSSTNECEGITCVTNSTDSNYVYVATTHNLLQVDVRNKKPVQKWTHLMSSPPQFGSSVQTGEQEVLVLQSWKVDEVVGVTNDRMASECFMSKSLPCLLRSVKESLKLTRCQGMCLNPSLPKRLNFAIAGIKCLKNNRGEIFLFAQNSGGDVFLNKIRKKVENGDVDVEEEKEVVESMKALDSHLERLLSETFDKTLKTFDMSHVFEVSGVQLSERKKKTSCEKPEMDWKYHEMYAPESLSLYRDVLARTFLKVWGYEVEHSDQEDEMLRAHEKVLEWMSKI